MVYLSGTEGFLCVERVAKINAMVGAQRARRVCLVCEEL
ncbi:hypothetical protein THOM_3059 [Trachipleistophora hominis]|uniref:Uncharacterized protein n=1 Tax=Trachipleistophora hominis TaxID=72359 RepID=L7JSK5_TRAHO|nr:hypothetical protein THOM_3059 [Trachipleistophora hominis]